MKIHIIKYLQVKIDMVAVIINAIRTGLWNGISISCGISDRDEFSESGIDCEMGSIRVDISDKISFIDINNLLIDTPLKSIINIPSFINHI